MTTRAARERQATRWQRAATHCDRMREMRRDSDVLDPMRALGLGVISQYLDDYRARRPCDLDIELWSEFSGVPADWIEQLLGVGA